MNEGDQLSRDLLRDKLKAIGFRGDVFFFPVIESTNDFARKLARESGIGRAVIAADFQTGGRGRRGRTWRNPAGDGICLSLLIRTGAGAGAGNSLITLVTAVAAAEALESVTGLNPKIKWPNDLILNGKKAGGILIEQIPDRAGRGIIIIGIGINVNTTAFPDELRDRAISLRQILGRVLNRADLITEITRRLENAYPALTDRSELDTILSIYREKSVTLGKNVTIKSSGGEFQGLVRRIGDDGALIVEKENGETVSCYSGEVSLGSY